MALDKCCCCIPLRKGSLAVAILYLAGNIIALIGITIWVIDEMVRAYDRRENDEWYQFHATDDIGRLENYEEHHAVRAAWFYFYMLLGLIGYSCISIPINTLLVRGIRKNQRKYMLPWVVWYAIVTALPTLIWLGGAGYLIYAMATAESCDGCGIPFSIFFIMMLPLLAGLIGMWICYTCVACYYNQLAPSDHYVMEPLPATRADEG